VRARSTCVGCLGGRSQWRDVAALGAALAQADPQGESAHPRHELQSHAADDDVRRNNPASGMPPAPARSRRRSLHDPARRRTAPLRHLRAPSLDPPDRRGPCVAALRNPPRDPHLVASIGRGTRAAPEASPTTFDEPSPRGDDWPRHSRKRPARRPRQRRTRVSRGPCSLALSDPQYRCRAAARRGRRTHHPRGARSCWP
jgi:hypothetical protein